MEEYVALMEALPAARDRIIVRLATTLGYTWRAVCTALERYSSEPRADR
jgi:hypothetical protein